jgi:hypothetical protein
MARVVHNYVGAIRDGIGERFESLFPPASGTHIEHTASDAAVWASDSQASK